MSDEQRKVIINISVNFDIFDRHIGGDLRSTTGAALLAFLLFPSSGYAFNEPPMNLGMTSFLDGGGGPPGVYLLEYLQDDVGAAARDKNGNVIPGGARVSAITQLNQIFYMSPYKVMGGYLSLDLTLPVVAVTASGSVGPVPLTAGNAGVGDFYPGLALQWNEHTFLGRPFFHRVEGFATVPTGSYSPKNSASPGSNVLGAEFYHALTWEFAPKWETSWRVGYIFNQSNDALAPSVRPGQAFHVNYALSREVSSDLRVGAAGYFMQQTTDDQIGGVSMPGTRERVAGLGPGLVYINQGLIAILSHEFEFAAENRFSGHRTTLQLIVHL